MRKKIVLPIIVILLLLAGIIAVTQEMDIFLPDPEFENEGFLQETESDEFFLPEYAADETPEWIRPARWFRSNAGGMALEEIPSRMAALRNKYALVVDYASHEDLPEEILPYYNNKFYIEIRTLYEDNEEVRTQWIFRDREGNSRLVAVLREIDADDSNDNTFAHEEETDLEDEDIETVFKKPVKKGFIEIYDAEHMLTTEYRFLDDGGINRTDFFYNNGIVIRALASSWGEDAGLFIEMHTDYYRYNRSTFLRFVERIYHTEQHIDLSEDTVRIAFPNRILETAKNDDFISEKINMYPDSIGNVTVNENNRTVFTTDGRGKILTQTLFDDEDNIIWVITNSWSKDRITSISKKDGVTEYLTEYEYDPDGNRIREKNIRDGIVERIVHTDDKIDTEELYINGNLVLVAHWQDGRKISESRMKKY
ncbi:MAG: hypothetical protein LBH44_05960 [Treponema sp.]|jgi:hypothetical protein|nr:hypothetical protein [Treponema sp.]